MTIQVGDKVRHKDNPNSILCDVIEVEDLGHGEGYERVRIQLPSAFLGLTRSYAAKELVVVKPFDTGYHDMSNPAFAKNQEGSQFVLDS